MLAAPTRSAWALPDTLSLAATNSMTHQPAVFNLQRYNLRATNYQVRVYTDATTYTLLSADQMPEVSTYRGRIQGDPGAFVVGAFGPDGKFYYNVSYGCRWQESTSEYDPYDGTNRLSWGGWGANFATTNIPTLGYSYVYQTNMPQHLTWSTANYPTNPPVSYGGPPVLNNFQQVPAQRVRIIQEMDQSVFQGTCGGNTSYAILMQESRINEMDYIMARDYGVCYQVVCICIRPYTNAPFTASGNSRLPQLSSYWGNDPGYSHGYFTNGWFDMAQASLYEGGGVAYAPGDWALTDPGFNGNVQGHENGHNWGAADYVTGWDYTGDNRWHCSHTGSGYDYGTDEAVAAINLRRNSWKTYYEWVRYNSPIAPHATPDFATTRTNLPVSLNVLLNDFIANSNTLSVVSFETNTPAGGLVANLGNGFLQYTPPANFTGYDLFHYYVGEPSGLKSLTGVKILVTNGLSPLLAEWTFDQTNGTAVVDIASNAPNGTLYGSASFNSGSVPGINGGHALHLDGAGYARFKGIWFDALNGSLSLSLWCKPDATPSGTQMLFMKCDNDWNRESGLKIGLTPTSIFVAGSTFGSSFGGFGATAPIVPQPGVWYHIVAELDRSSNLVRLFVNGVEYTATSNTRSIPAGEFVVGENWPITGAANSTHGWGSYFTGALDDLRLYTKALSASEVAALYQGGGLLPAGGPDPANGERNVRLQPALTWVQGGSGSLQFDVYLGTSSNAVAGATTNSSLYQGRFTSASFVPSANLATNTTYFWRVDEVSGTNLIASDVWSFTTAIDAIHGGLKLYLSFDNRDTVGTNTYDRSSPPFHDGALYNSPLQTTGQVCEALSFNGSSAYVETPALNLNTARATFLAWVKRSGTSSSYAGLVFCRGGTTISGLDIRGTSNQLGYHWNDSASSYNFVSGLTLPDGQWALAALTVETNRAIFYLGLTNGVLQTAINNYTHVMQAFDAPLDIARDSAGGRNFSGSIDEVCVWDRPLTAAEIGQILTNGLSGASFGGGRPVPLAGTFTWTGNSDTYWTNTLNWATNAVPAATSTVLFNDAATGNTATQLGQDLSVAGLTVSGGLRGMGVGGANLLTLGASGLLLTNTSATATLSGPVRLGSAQTWNVADGGTLSVTGTLTNSGFLLTLTNNNVVNFNGLVSGAGGLAHNGPGTVTLTTANSYSGGTTVNGGKLVSTVSCWYSPRGIGSGSLTVNAGATAEFTAAHGFGSGAGGQSATVNGGTLQFDAENYVSGLTMTGGSLIGTGELRTPGNLTYNFNASAASSVIRAGINLVYGSLTFNVANGAAEPDLQIFSSIYGSGGGISKTGAGSMTLTRACSYTGSTTVSQGTLKLSGDDNLLPAGTSLSVSSGATLTLDNINQSVHSLSGTGTINLGSGSLTDLPTTNSDTFGGVITGAPAPGGATDYLRAPSGGLAKDGPGKLTLTSSQSYSGDTWVLAGTLALSGAGALPNSANLSLSSGASLDVTARTDGSLNLNPGQTLLGYGTVLGKVSVANGATIAPGDNVPGSLTTGAQTWSGGGSYTWQISDPANNSGWDLLSISGTLNIQATAATKFVLKLVSLGPDFAPGLLNAFNNRSNYQWVIATTTAGLQNFNPAAFAIDATSFSNPLAGGSFSLTQSGNALVLLFTPPPPPVLVNGSAQRDTNGFSFAFSGQNGQSYTILSTTNLALPLTSWLTNVTGFFGPDGLAHFTNSSPTNTAEFYRVQSP